MQHAVLYRVMLVLVGAVLGVLALAWVHEAGAQSTARGRDTITATGVGIVPPGSLNLSSAPVVLSIHVQAQGPDASSAISQANTQAQTIKAALEKAGVAMSAILVTGFSVFPQRGEPRDPSSPPPIGGDTAGVDLQAVVSGTDQLGAVITAAIAAGATDVLTFLSGPPQGQQPPTNNLAAALSEAMDQAKTTASLAASKVGVTLGRVLAVEVETPRGSFFGRALAPWGLSPGSSPFLFPGGLPIAVTVTYKIER